MDLKMPSPSSKFWVTVSGAFCTKLCNLCCQCSTFLPGLVSPRLMRVHFELLQIIVQALVVTVGSASVIPLVN